MRPWPRSSATRIGTGALLGALAWALFAPAPVRASCGDYVTMRPQHSSTQQAPSQHPSPPAASQTEPDWPPISHAVLPCPPCRESAPPDGLPLPCRGPGCSAPTTPDSSTALAPVPHPDDWSVPARAICFAPPVPVDSFADTGCGHLVRQPSAVYHPPRSPHAS
jgi:hypothetical protein